MSYDRVDIHQAIFEREFVDVTVVATWANGEKASTVIRLVPDRRPRYTIGALGEIYDREAGETISRRIACERLNVSERGGK